MRCVYRGEQTKQHFLAGKLTTSYICSCEYIDQQRCTLEPSTPQFATCEGCESRLEFFPDPELDYTKSRWQYISVARFNQDTKRLLSVIPPDCSGIVGVPRSGMIPAALLATLTQLPLFEFSVQHGLRQLGEGSRNWLTATDDKAGPFFVVDDSIYSGNAMSLTRASFPVPAIFAAVYVIPEMAHFADYYVQELSSPHFFEWNIFNNGIIDGLSMDPRLRGGVAMDLDGIICFDPPMPDADEGPIAEAYADWIDNAQPKYIPRFAAVPCIITFRLEKWRDRTIKWLRKYKVNWRRLIMSTHSSVIERNRNLDVVGHKARNFIESGCSLMIESDPAQAEMIHQLSRRPVLCPDSERLYQDHCDWEALLELDRWQPTLSHNATASPSPEDDPEE